MRARESVFVYRTASGFTRLLALTLLALTVAAFVFLRATRVHGTEPSDFHHWVFASEAGHDSDEAVAEDLLGIPSYPGCEGVAGILFGTDPAWVRVGLSTSPNTPFVEARGQLLQPNPDSTDFANPRITWKDTTTNHWSMDINAYLTLDPGYRHLLATGDEFSGTLDIEWERGGVPMYAWPSTGDRMTVWGTHIWDCGHGDTYFGGDYFYHTEIHSPVGWVVYRNSADADQAPDSEAKRTRDWVWYDSGDLQGSAATMLSTGTLNTPVHATVADAFFSSFGGNVPESVNGCDTDPEIVGFTCTQNNEWRQNVLQQPYTFFVPSPARPAGNPVMIWESEDRCAAVPSDPANPPHDDPEDVGDAGVLSTAHDIGTPTCGMSESVTEGVDENGRPGIWVTVNGTPTSYPANNYIAFAKRYKVGWDFIPPPAQSARQIRVDFNTLRVYNDGEPCIEDGEWLLALGANEGWIYPVRGSGDGGDPFWEFGAVDDGHVCIGDDDPFKDYSISAGVNIIAAHDQPIMFFSGGFESDILLTIGNDIIPWLLEARDPGTYTSSLAQGADGPIYRIIYTITDISLPAPTPGTLTIGDPKYGPNADTGGTATRVSKLTPIKLDGSDATQLEFRYWKDGDARPTTWGLDADASDDLKVDLTAASSDGRYTIEYAPVSPDGIVGERRTVAIELDSTAPALTVPDDMVVDATSAAGRIVNYVATAEDALPGPVEFSCAPASGSFFPIKTVTTVTCTATDAVDNESTDSFTVEVVSPFGYIPDFVALGRQWINLANNVIVQTGNIGAFDTSAGVPSSSGIEVVIGPSAILTGGPKVAGQSVRLQSGTQAGNVYAVDPVQVGSGVTYTAKSGYVPLFLGMPTVPVFVAGAKSKDFSGAGNVLAAGSYRNLKLAPNAVVTLTGGSYNVSNIEIGSNAQLLFSAATNVHVTGRVTVGNSSRLLPVAGSGVAPRQIVFWVTGTDGSSSAFQTSNDVQMRINAYAPNGTMNIGPYNDATGAFLGLRVSVQNNTTLNLDSAFDYP